MSTLSALTASYTSSYATTEGRRVHPLVTLDYGVRTVAMLMLFLIVASRLIEGGASPVSWTFAVLNGFVWPHLAYQLAWRSRDQRATEHRNLLLDAANGGAWIAFLHASLWPSMALMTAILMGITGVGGMRLLARALLTGLAGFALSALLLGFRYRPEASDLTTAICIVNIVAFTIIFALYSFSQSRRLIAARKLSEQQGQEIARSSEQLSAARDTAEEAQQRAQAANRAKSMFLANMSHELRTPLNAIIGYSEMLQEEASEMTPEEIADDLRKVTGAGKHLLSLINDVLDFSKIEAGRMDLVLEETDPRALVRDVQSTAAPLVAKHGNRFEVEIAESVGIMISDSGKVRQVLLNLLSNAAKFTKQGTVSLRAYNFDKDGEPWIAFSVRDTGIGLTREQFGKLFQAFAQADATTHRDHGGTGLGLALCRRFCVMMGGDIEVQSKQGVGSEFTVQLPVRGPQGEEAVAAATGDAVDDSRPMTFHTTVYRIPVIDEGVT